MAGQPGAFTQMFQPPARPIQDDDLSRRLNSGTEAPRTPPPGIPAPPARSNEPGDFTKMFAAPTKPPPAQGFNPNAADYSDKLYARPNVPLSGGPPPIAQPSAPPPGGSEFTRAMQRVSYGELAPLTPPKPKVEEPAAPKSSGRLPVVLIVVGVIVVLAIVLVLTISLSGI